MQVAAVSKCVLIGEIAVTFFGQARSRTESEK
jgi:hypothetical protein